MLVPEDSHFSAVSVPSWEPGICVATDVTDSGGLQDFMKRARAGYETPAICIHEPEPLTVMGRHFAVISRHGGLVEESIHTIGKFKWHQAFAKVRAVRIHHGDGEAPIIAASSGFSNYYHWTAETLGTLLMLRAMEPHHKPPIVIPKMIAKWQSSLFDLFGIENAIIEVADNEAAVFDDARLTNITGRSYAFAPHPALLREFRAQLPPLESGQAIGDKIYIARRDATARQMVNEAELCDMLASHGFDIVVTGSLSVQEQAHLFNRVRVVIAPHGASLTNLLYSPDGAEGPEVVELLQENYLGRGLAKLSQGKRLDYTAIINPCVDASDYHQTSSWRADIDFIERLVVERWGQ